MTVPSWNSEDNDKLFTLFCQFWMRQFSKASWQKHRELLPVQVESQKINFQRFLLGFFVCWFVIFLVLWGFFNGSCVKMKKVRCQHLMLSCTSYVLMSCLNLAHLRCREDLNSVIKRIYFQFLSQQKSKLRS